jgi:DNA modification methylase
MIGLDPDSTSKFDRAAYDAFLRAKMVSAPEFGIEVAPGEVNPLLEPHQRDIVIWALRGGRRAIFAAFGLGKSIIQIEILRLLLKHLGGRYVIVCPLGVRQEFGRDGMLDTEAFRRRAAELGLDHAEIVTRCSVRFRFVRRDEEVDGDGLYLTNYESVRDGKLNPRQFTGASLDEASVLRGFGGTKTFREFMRLFDGLRFKFVATATPSPNEYIELLAYSAFLEIMDVGEAKTRFFKRNSEKADHLTIHEHKRREFWLWCASWAIFLQWPSDLGYSDEGYALPGIDIYWHEIPSDHSDAGYETSGQGRLVKNAAIGVVDAAREKRDSLPGRIAKMLELRALDPGAHRIIWHDLEAERHAIERAVPGITAVWGTQDLEERQRRIIAFSDGEAQELATKPIIAGSGCNFQWHCAWEIFLGIGFKFNDFIQAIHRCHRFLQTRRVRIDLIYTEAEREVRRILEQKWRQHEELMAEMAAIIREFGLARASLASSLQRSIGVERAEASGAGWHLVNNDCILETAAMPDASVDMVLTSIPFSTQYEYTPSYNDFGHTDSNEHFWQQMDFLTPELLRILKPGRIAAIHVKDRIVPGGINGMGFQTVYRFSDACCDHFERHGFAFLGRKTIVTDVVRENNQTYRLGWTEQCKDGTKMGVGMPEYLLIFRRPPSDTSNSYADQPVVKDKGRYSRSRWQIDAHGFARSSGDRLLSSGDLSGLRHDQIFRLFRDHSLRHVYDYEQHVALAESLERCPDCGHIHIGKRVCAAVELVDGPCECRKPGGSLPVTFMLLQPASWSDEVWSDVTRMRTLNGAQSAAGREQHLCPMQLDIADRAITQFTMIGESVYDPFAGIGTVPQRAVLLGRQGRGCELGTRYWGDSIGYCRAAEQKVATPTLFDLLEVEEVA